MHKLFATNTAGRDFVIGDLHGCYELFLKLLEHLQFDAEKDRMFSVGDLVDRGPDSYSCLKLLDEPWFHSVLANHEQMMVEAFFDHYLGIFWPQNGGLWGLEALNDWRAKHQRPPSDESADIKRLVDKAAELPVVITIQLQNDRKVHVLHAELPLDEKLTDSDIEQQSNLFLASAMSPTSDGAHICWGRNLYYHFYADDLSNYEKVKRTVFYNSARNRGLFNPELSHIVSGHTPVQRPLTLLGQTNIDTGAFFCYDGKNRSWCGLTCLDINAWKFYQARPAGGREVQPVVVQS